MIDGAVRKEVRADKCFALAQAYAKQLLSKQEPVLDIEFAEWIDAHYDKESEDEYILKSDYAIPFCDEDHETKNIKQLHSLFIKQKTK